MSGWGSLVYGALLLVGGVMGYQRAGSRPSLIAGLGLGGVVLIGSVMLLVGNEGGRGLALFGVVVATLFFGFRLSSSLRTEDRSPARAALLFVLGIAAAATLVLGTPAHGAPNLEVKMRGIDEASGVIRFGDRLALVGDDVPEFCFVSPTPDEFGDFLLRPEALERRPLPPEASDLESLTILGDGRLVALSEDRHALYDADGLVAQWSDAYREIGGRGLEGVCTRPQMDRSSIVAVLWEGGYPDCRSLARADRDLCGRPLRPRIAVHRLPANARDFALTDDAALFTIELSPPLPAGEEPLAQRFRAADFVWDPAVGADLSTFPREGKAAFWVLISSGHGTRKAVPAGSDAECSRVDERGKPRRYCYRWVQRFDLSGQPIGEPLDLDDHLEDPIANSNLEGMAWWEAGRSLVICYDEKYKRRAVDPQRVVHIELPERFRE